MIFPPTKGPNQSIIVVLLLLVVVVEVVYSSTILSTSALKMIIGGMYALVP